MTRPLGLTVSRHHQAIVSASQARPVTSSTASSRFEAVSSGPQTPKIAAATALSRASRPAGSCPRCGSLCADGPRRVYRPSRRNGRKSGRGRSDGSAAPPLACGFAPSLRSLDRRRQFGAISPRSAAAILRQTVPRVYSCASTLPAPATCAGVLMSTIAAPGVSARSLRSSGRPRSSARSSPWGCLHARSSASADALGDAFFPCGPPAGWLFDLS